MHSMQKWNYFMVKRFITQDEIDLLNGLSKFFAKGSEEARANYNLNNTYDIVDTTSDGIQIKWEDGNEQGYLAMVLLTLNTWDSSKQPLITKNQKIYMIPKDKMDDPKTYNRLNMLNYEVEIESIVGNCINRFGKAINKKAIAGAIMSLANQDTPFVFDPYKDLVNLYIKKVKNSDLARVEFDEFKSKFKQINEAAPYTDFVLRLLLIQPWAVMFHKKTPQHMPIFKSEQGVGKSTIISILGLSWAEEIKTLAGKSNSEKLEIANKRELNAVLEFAEMSRFTTTSIEENKSAITVREEQLMLKFSNFMTNFTYKALIIGSTNSDAFLKDNTGERRYLPLEIESFSYDLTVDFVGRAIATAIIDNDARVEAGEDEMQVWNIYHEETAEDLVFKRANFGLQDLETLKVQSWIKDQIKKRANLGRPLTGFWAKLNGEVPDEEEDLKNNPVVAVDMDKKLVVLKGQKTVEQLWATRETDTYEPKNKPSVFPVINFKNQYKIQNKRIKIGDTNKRYMLVPFEALPDVSLISFEKLAKVASLDILKNEKPVITEEPESNLPF